MTELENARVNYEVLAKGIDAIDRAFFSGADSQTVAHLVSLLKGSLRAIHDQIETLEGKISQQGDIDGNVQEIQ